MRCSQCKEDLPREAFYKNAARSTGLSSHCMVCDRARQATPGALKSARQRTLNRTLTAMNLTTSDYERMLAEQHGVCAVCHQFEKGNRRLSIDHSHETKRVRGLLCSECNTSLGYVEKFLREPGLYQALRDFISRD